ncbi:hypothetical protein CYY_009816, partial [Polysphondylium violaceum]
FNTAGKVTISGSYFAPPKNLVVTIGGTQCTLPSVSSDGTSIICSFSADVTVGDFRDPLPVTVVIDTIFTDTKSVFYYNRPNPTITAATSIKYDVPGLVTITGTYFASTNLIVKIGGGPCTGPVVNSETELVCTFQSNVVVSDFKDSLVVSVSVDSVSGSAPVFKYIRPNPIISSATSLVYKAPGQVTISGNYFASDNLIVTIGGNPCSSPVVSQGGNQLTCQFQADVVVSNFVTPLLVFISVDSFTSSNDVFYYTRPNPVITSATSTVYGVPGIVTITGTYFDSDNLLVKIGTLECTSAVVSQTKDSIVCSYPSSEPVDPKFKNPLSVFVSVKSIYTSSKPVFYYIRPLPVITDCSSTVYGTPEQITITGNYFATDTLYVEVGGKECPNASSSSNQITCDFSSDVPVDRAFSDSLNIFVSVDGNFNNTTPVFYYTRPNPVITSSTSTFFSVPGQVSISGKYFDTKDLIVQIGQKDCASLSVDQAGTTISCTFTSDVPVADYGIPLDVFVSVASNSDTQQVFYYAIPSPTIASASSTVYNISGLVTVRGDQFLQDDLVVEIGGVNCQTPVAHTPQNIVCSFPSNATLSSFEDPLNVFVSIKSLYTATQPVFYYTRPNPIIQTCTSLYFNHPGQVTITGTYIASEQLSVSIGGAQCTSPVASADEKSLTCLYQAKVAFKDYRTPLDVTVSVDSKSSTRPLFYYIRPNPIVISSTSTKYLTPGIVTIEGAHFELSESLFVSIGGSICSNAVSNQEGTSITCQYLSDIAVTDSQKPLDVFVNIDSKYNTTKAVFLYVKQDKACPVNVNGLVCSGHGTCSPQFTCSCEQGWESYDCSLENKRPNIPDPSINPNDTSSTIVTPSGTMFDVGIVLINELDPNNNIVHSYNISAIQWNNITKQDNIFVYSTTLLNTGSTLNVKLTVNTLNERIYYDFAGDIIPILPKSIKYQVELQNYTFGATLNTMEFIFKSGISQRGGECVYDESTKTQTSLDSVRSIQMTLNGETLVGTFSDRIVIDDRPSYNKVSKLVDQQITQNGLDTQNVYVSITTAYFQQSVVVDPNFGVLISAQGDEQACKKPFEAWKIGTIVACSTIGVAAAGTTAVMIKKKRAEAAFNTKLSTLSRAD